MPPGGPRELEEEQHIIYSRQLRYVLVRYVPNDKKRVVIKNFFKKVLSLSLTLKENVAADDEPVRVCDIKFCFCLSYI